MATHTDSPSGDTHKQLQKELIAAEAKEQTAQAQVEAAKAALTAAKSESKKLRTIIELYVGRPSSTSLTKKTVRPLVEQVLAIGPLPEKELLSQLDAEVQSRNLTRVGLSLVVRSLRREFADASGRWSIPIDKDRSVATKSAGSEQTTKPGAEQ